MRHGRDQTPTVVRKTKDECRPAAAAFPLALRLMMDMPRANGMSPYDIVTGRDRRWGGVLHTPSRECVGAPTILQRR